MIELVLAACLAAQMDVARLKVTARGSSFRFRESDPDPGVVGQVLDVRYVLTGLIERFGRDLAISLELARPVD